MREHDHEHAACPSRGLDLFGHIPRLCTWLVSVLSEGALDQHTQHLLIYINTVLRVKGVYLAGRALADEAVLPLHELPPKHIIQPFQVHRKLM